MKKTFLAGLAILLPIAVTLFVVFFIVDFLTAPFVGIVEDFITNRGTIELAAYHKHLLLFASRVIVLILFLTLVFILGALGRKLFFSWFINLTHRIFYKIPIIKTIYKVTLEISSSVFSDKKKALFKGTVAVPFPNSKAKVLGLLSGNPPDEVAEKKDKLQTVFVPTSPHPISGFLMMYDDQEVQKTDIETEDLFKFLLSCGMSHPNEEK
ncbi:MAG: DUF502 domain-containing protein [Candidatus Neptunochlamydia sp.]|nr:DUF502 domain-containing protein [Candidatus Neptunochlamydia sp.]